MITPWTNVASSLTDVNSPVTQPEPKLGVQLAEARAAAGLTQVQVAERLGVKRVTVSNWERGHSVPDEAKLKRLADLYGTTPVRLRYGQHWAGIVEAMIADELTGARYERAPQIVSAWVESRLPIFASYPGVDDATLPLIGAYLLAPAVWLFYGGVELDTALRQDVADEELSARLHRALEKAELSIRRELLTRRLKS